MNNSKTEEWKAGLSLNIKETKITSTGKLEEFKTDNDMVDKFDFLGCSIGSYTTEKDWCAKRSAYKLMNNSDISDKYYTGLISMEEQISEKDLLL